MMTPIQRRAYFSGALAARDYLRHTQADLRIHRQLRPDTLRWELAYASRQPPEFRAGFLDGIGAFVSMVLEGCQINPDTWEVLTALERAGESQ
ncbi:hypothetical protein [Ralstonia sp. A12]|uniref:hypothetical protein n=1 Tax=Ralstonia sp. A12 TaxID=1217052 RepID=UPI000AF53991|nr:hypothetical protein [Ralstonia sp. A12]